MHFKNIQEIDTALRQGKTISLQSKMAVGACVTFSADTVFGYREVQGCATEPEREISSITEATQYIWRERKRIVKVI
jgi:hypothetical protein